MDDPPGELIKLSKRLAAVIRQIREHADPTRLFAQTDIAQVVGRLVALEAVVFDDQDTRRMLEQHELAKRVLQQLVKPPDNNDSLFGLAEKAAGIVESAQRVLAKAVGHASLGAQVEEAASRLRATGPPLCDVCGTPADGDGSVRCEAHAGWDYIRSAEHKAVEEAAIILAKLAPGLGNVSLKTQAEEVRRRFGLLREKISAIAESIAGVVRTPAKRWKKSGLHHHLAAVGQDLKSACEG
jgi:hypothetical protein